MSKLARQLQLAEHLLEHASDHVVVLAAVNLADLIRRHRPRATNAMLALTPGAQGRLITPSLPIGVELEANAFARHLTDETWAMWEGLADDEPTRSPQTGTRLLALNLNTAARLFADLVDPTGANCPRSCPIWREEGIGVPDIGPCHTCGAGVSEDCRPHCPYPMRLGNSTAHLQNPSDSALTIPFPGH